MLYINILWLVSVNHHLRIQKFPSNFERFFDSSQQLGLLTKPLRLYMILNGAVPIFKRCINKAI